MKVRSTRKTQHGACTYCGILMELLKFAVSDRFVLLAITPDIPTNVRHQARQYVEDDVARLRREVLAKHGVV